MRAALVAFAVLRFGLRLELGPEFDSNANRAETSNAFPEIPKGDSLPAAPIASFLVRGTSAANLGWTAGRNTLRIGATVAGKIFFAGGATPQDQAVVQFALDDTIRTGDALLGLGGDYHDATQWVDCLAIISGGAPRADPSCHRDFRDGGPAAPAGGGRDTGAPVATEASETRLGVSLRGVVDPGTLDELRRAEAGSDPEAQLRALRRMQSGLKTLADDLGRRESELRKRAREIKPRK